MTKPIYNTEEERHEAKLEAKRKWRENNKDHIHKYNKVYYGRTRKVFRDNPSMNDLVKHWSKIRKDLESLSRTKVAEKWSTSRRTLGRLIDMMEETA